MKQYRIMILNLGSTSYKFKLFEGGKDGERTLAEGGFENIGSGGGWYLRAGTFEESGEQKFADHMEAFRFSAEKLAESGTLASLDELDAVGYKSVHAGTISGARRIDGEMLAVMERCSTFAPAHNPVYIRMMKQVQAGCPHLLQIGYFETSFHAQIPEKRVTYGVPAMWRKELGIRRYGFHGSSHSYIAWKLGELQPEARRVISLHLGGSSSVCAIADGKSVASSMGATPQSGLFQNNRVGDFDIFCLPALMEYYHGDWEKILQILSREGGLLGVSGVSGDLREVQRAADEGNADAQLAIDAFVDGIVGYVGMFTAYLKGLDAIVFTGGIGCGSSLIRERVCGELSFMGVRLDAEANRLGREGRISADGSPVAVYRLRTNEELMVFRQCLRVLEDPQGN